MSQRASSFTSFLQSNLLQTVDRASLVVRGISIVLVTFYLLSFIPGFASVISVNPGTSFPPHFRVWTFITAGLLETHWWNVLIDIGVTIMAAQMLEPLWTSREFLKYIAVVNVGSSVLTSLVFVVFYIVFRSDRLLFTSFHGYVGVVAGLLVACKQVMPDYSLVSTSFIKIKIQLLPLIFFLSSIAVTLTGVTSLDFPTLIGAAIIVGWLYLRFYQPHKEMKGDMSESFAFATFFPEKIQPCLQTIGNPLYTLAVSLKLCPKKVRTVDVGSLSSVTISLPGMEKADADRRRQKALKALDERLSKTEPHASWPSMTDEAETTTTTTTPTTVNQSDAVNEEVPLMVTQADLSTQSVVGNEGEMNGDPDSRDNPTASSSG
eukprot:m.43721 g.43721  ORF g.43721 m.43721 type:complete len:377 (+) comp33470_c0_seq3:30-1160(+)